MDWIYLAQRNENLGRKDKFLQKRKNCYFLVCCLVCFSFKADSTIYQDTLGKYKLQCWLLSQLLNSPFVPCFVMAGLGIYNPISPQPGSSRGFPVSLYQKECSRDTGRGKKGRLFPCFSLLVRKEKSFILAAATDSSVGFLNKPSSLLISTASSLEIPFPSSSGPFSELVSFNNSNLFPFFSRGEEYFLKVLHPPFYLLIFPVCSLELLRVILYIASSLLK